MTNVRRFLLHLEKDIHSNVTERAPPSLNCITLIYIYERRSPPRFTSCRKDGIFLSWRGARVIPSVPIRTQNRGGMEEKLRNTSCAGIDGAFSQSPVGKMGCVEGRKS